MSRFPWAATGLAATLLIAGCAGQAEDESSVPAGTEPAAAGESVLIDPAILDHPSRSEDDHYRDGGFKPLEVYAFFGIEPGMTVADFSPARGYHTLLMSQIVGDQGKVVGILRPRADNAERLERSRSTYAETVAAAGLTNVQIVDDLAATEPESLDLFLTVRNYHDLGTGAERLAVLHEIMRTLKPGGILAAIDVHTNKTDGRDESVHRINDLLARQEITSAGFEFIASSDVLANVEDTYDFDGRERAGVRGAEQDAPIHRYYVHRWVQKFRKPLQ